MTRQCFRRVVFFDPEGLVVFENGVPIGTTSANLHELQRLQAALGHTGEIALCLGEGT